MVAAAGAKTYLSEITIKHYLTEHCSCHLGSVGIHIFQKISFFR